jgi:aspartyl/asparaginyl beta-hydroxylase (cupin superfamily)
MFQTLEFYPELKVVKNHFKEIKEEVLSLRSKMTYINDVRVDTDVWNIFPLLPEEEDRSVISEEIWKNNQLLAPKSTKILSSIEALKAYSFSSLSVGGHIRPHKHDNNFVTAILCIQDGGNSYIIVKDEKKNFKNNEILVFDYKQEHEVYNKGNNDRIVLLMLLENRCLRK